MKLVHKPFAILLLAAFVLAAAATTAPGGAAANPACENDRCIDGRVVNPHTSAAAYALTEPTPGEFRFELRPGDRWAMDRAPLRERTELSFDEAPVSFGKTYRVAYEMQIEGNAAITSKWCVIGQWHASEDPGDAPSSPPLGLSLEGRDLVVTTQSTTAPRHTKNPAAVERARLRDIPRNRWIAISYDVRFDALRGWLDLTIDGERAFAGAIPIGYKDATGLYFKFGIYRAPASETLVVRYRNLTIRERAPGAAP